MPWVSNFIPPSQAAAFSFFSRGSKRKRAQENERNSGRRRKRDRRDTRKRRRCEEKKGTKSVNFLTFYEPSEFHNREPARLVLCTGKVSRLRLFSFYFTLLLHLSLFLFFSHYPSSSQPSVSVLWLPRKRMWVEWDELWDKNDCKATGNEKQIRIEMYQ